MHIEAVEVRRLRLPLLTPFRTSSGIEQAKDVVVVQVHTAGGGSGWGECGAMSEPTYTPEYADGAEHVLIHHLLPRLAAATDVCAADVADLLRGVKGHHMAKAAVEMAVLDAELRAGGWSFARHLGGVRTVVDAGVSVGIHDDVASLVAAVEGYVAAGYRRVKIKIEPGHDIEAVAAVRRAVGDDVALQVDANTAYTLADAHHLARLDDYGLVLIEQPLGERDLRGHTELAKRLRTPVCLDESIESAQDAAEAVDAGACSIVNIKAGRVGGYLEAVRVHDACAERGAAVWCGGMLETGLGRAANVALASLPGFTLPGDLSASDRYFAEDLTEPFVLEDGRLRVPTGPGLGVVPRPEALRRFTHRLTTVR